MNFSLNENILAQAKFFLENADEFYPFGAVIDWDNKIKPIGIYLEDDHPASVVILEKLNDYILASINSKKCQSGAIGLDVLIKKKENNTKVDALEIRHYDSQCNICKVHYEYKKIGIEYKFSVTEV